VATVLARSDYHAVAAALGAEGIVVRTSAEVDAALTRARAFAQAGKPVLVNVWLERTAFRDGAISM
jgi:acetolactate synthase-1/2/3 large subunit